MTATCTLADLIRQRRTELGLTQEQLADRIGLGTRQADVSRLERGRVGLPRRERLQRIAAALELPLGELLVRSGWVGADILDQPAATDLLDRPAASAPDERPPVTIRSYSVLPVQPRLAPMPATWADHTERSLRLRAAMERSHEVAQQAIDAHQRAARIYKLILEGSAKTRLLGRVAPSRIPHDP